MGTPLFAADSLSALLEAGHQVVAVVTRPDAPSGRGLAVKPSAVKVLAGRHGIPVLQPPGVRGEPFLGEVSSLSPDILVVVAFGRILPAALLEIAPFGAINVHASLLPRYRGAAPVAWAIASGEKETGVTTQRIIERLDAGDILLQRATPIGSEETAAQLERRLSSMGAALLVETLAGLQAGSIVPRPQDESLATNAPILRKHDGLIDWSWSARLIDARVRGFNPWPVAHTVLPGSGRRMLIWAVRPAGRPAAGGEPGRVLDEGGSILVACGEGEALRLEEVQPEGSRRMPAAAAAAGRYLRAGDRLGTS